MKLRTINTIVRASVWNTVSYNVNEIVYISYSSIIRKELKFNPFAIDNILELVKAEQHETNQR